MKESIKKLAVASAFATGLTGVLAPYAEAHPPVTKPPVVKAGQNYNPEILSQMIQWHSQQITGRTWDILNSCDRQGPYKQQVEEAFRPKEPLLYFGMDGPGEGMARGIMAFYDKSNDRTVIVYMVSGGTDVAVYKGQILKNYPLKCDKGGIDFTDFIAVDSYNARQSIRNIKEGLDERLKKLNATQPVRLELVKFYVDDLFWEEGKFGMFVEGKNSRDFYYDGIAGIRYDSKHPNTQKIKGAVNDGYQKLLNQAGEVLRVHAPQQIKKQKDLAAKIRQHNADVEKRRIESIRGRARR